MYLLLNLIIKILSREKNNSQTNYNNGNVYHKFQNLCKTIININITVRLFEL